MAFELGASYWLATVSVCLLVALSCGELEDEIDWDLENAQEWVDPTDMLNYDLGSQSMKRPPTPDSKFKRPHGVGKISQSQEDDSGEQPDLVQRPFGVGKASQWRDGDSVVETTGQLDTSETISDHSNMHTAATLGIKPPPASGEEADGAELPAESHRIKRRDGMGATVVKTAGEATPDSGGVSPPDIAAQAKVDKRKGKKAKLVRSGSAPDARLHQRTAQHGGEGTQQGARPTCDCRDYVASLAALRGETDTLAGQLEECRAADSRPPPEQPYLKQYINVLLKNFREQGLPSNEDVTYRLNCELSADDVTSLERYVSNSKVGVQDAHSVLVHMIAGVTRVTEPEPAFEIPTSVHEYLAMCGQIVCIGVGLLMAVYVYVKLDLSWTQLFFKVLVLLFFVSIPWNWWHLYNVEIAKRQAVALQDAPPECRPEKLSLWQSLSAAFSLHTDKCAKYHEKLLVDPMWEVPPTKAVAVTLAKFFLEPLEHIGEHLGLFVRASLQDLPVHLWPFVFTFSVVVALVVIIMSFGYKLRLFYLFGLEPPAPRVGSGATGVVQQGIEEIREEIKKLADTPARAPTPAPPSLPSIPSLSAEKVEEIVFHAVQSHIPPPKPTRVAYAALPAPAPPKVDMVDSQTQSTPKVQKRLLSSTHVASYSYAGTESDGELAPEQIVTRQSSVVQRDNWSQTWITSGTDGKFSDLDDMTFCKMHPSWKPYQTRYFQPYYYQGAGEPVAENGHDSSTDPDSSIEKGSSAAEEESEVHPLSDLIDSGSVLSPRPESRASRARDSATCGSQTAPLPAETLHHQSANWQAPPKQSKYSKSPLNRSGPLNLSMK